MPGQRTWPHFQRAGLTIVVMAATPLPSTLARLHPGPHGSQACCPVRSARSTTSCSRFTRSCRCGLGAARMAAREEGTRGRDGWSQGWSGTEGRWFGSWFTGDGGWGQTEVHWGGCSQPGQCFREVCPGGRSGGQGIGSPTSLCHAMALPCPLFCSEGVRADGLWGRLAWLWECRGCETISGLHWSLLCWLEGECWRGSSAGVSRSSQGRWGAGRESGGSPHGAPLVCTLDSLRSSRWSLLTDPGIGGLQGSRVLYGHCSALPWLVLSGVSFLEC